jgi:hypothetical protein
MPQWDRYWPLGLVSGALLMAASLTLSVWYLASLFSLPQHVGLPPLTDPGEFGGLVIWGGGPAGLSLFSSARAARKRSDLRSAALRGDVAAIPLARLTVPPEEAPAEADLPITFVERTPTNSRRAQIAGNILLGFLFCLLWGFFFALMAVLLRSINFPDDPLVFAALTSFLLAAFIALALYYVGRASGAHAAYGVRADVTGIRQLRRDGEGSLLRWEDARLLELSTDSAGAAKYDHYTLYFADATVRWRDYRLPAGTPTKTNVSLAESDRQLHQLLALVAARTGLQPRTLVRQLQRTPDPSPHTGNRVGTIVGFAFVLTVGLVLLAAGVAAIALPLTPNLVLNLYSFATLALSGSAVAAFVLRHWGFAPAPPVHRERNYAPPAPPPTLPGASYGFMSGIRPSNRLRLILVGLALAANLVPAVVSVFIPPVLHLLLHLVATVLLLVGIIGLFILGVALLLRPTRVWIDDAGLHERTGRKRRELPWTAIEEVNLHLVDDQSESVEVRGESDQMAIVWLARDITWMPAHETMHPVSPEELAALVVARSGVSLTIKEA